MTLYCGFNGVWKPVVTVYVGRGGSWISASQSELGVNGSYNNGYVAQPFTVTVMPTVASASSAQRAPGTTQPITATPANGTAPYTYQWSYVSGDTGLICATPTAASTTFRATNVYTSYNSTWQCVVTDAKGRTAVGTVSILIFGSGVQQ